jgi:aspartyl protease family protein
MQKVNLSCRFDWYHNKIWIGGYTQAALTYGLKVATAAGEARAARIILPSVAVDGAVVRNVDALVLDRDTDASLLGMSYLRRLSGFEANPDTLRLHP